MPTTVHKAGARFFNALVPFLVVIIFAGTFAPFFYFIIQPKLENYLAGGPSNVGTIQSLLTSRQAYRDSLKGLFDFYQTVTANKQDPLMMVLPGEEDIPTLYASFEQIAKNANVGIRSIDIVAAQVPAPNAKKEPFQSAHIDLRFVNVDYAGLKRLVDGIESNIRLTKITSFTFDPIGHSATFSVETYYLTGGH